MTRHFLILALSAGLAACTPAVPDSAAHLSNGSVNPGRGVGFDNSIAQERAREAARAQAQLPAAAPVTAQPLPPGPSTALAPTPQPPQAAPQVATTAPAPAPRPAPASTAAAPSSQGVVNASPTNAPPPLIQNPGGISNETDFEAVSARRSIEGDAARQAQLRAQYQVVAPTALPSRSGSGPNIVQYALQTSHTVGTRLHRRVSVASASRTQARCAEYASDDDAQSAFLAAGGPQRDRLRLDPDGDGFACGWNPVPFRRAAGN